jgi:hypothetical protein
MDQFTFFSPTRAGSPKEHKTITRSFGFRPNVSFRRAVWIFIISMSRQLAESSLFTVDITIQIWTLARKIQ